MNVSLVRKGLPLIVRLAKDFPPYGIYQVFGIPLALTVSFALFFQHIR